MSDKYILEGTSPVLCNDLLTWGRWMETADRHVARDERDGVVVSTVFLGLNHAFGPGQPLLFETMIFGGPSDQDQARYSTWAEATAGHAVMCAKAFPRPPESLGRSALTLLVALLGAGAWGLLLLLLLDA